MLDTMDQSGSAAEIPKEWKTANEALQGVVQQSKGEASPVANSRPMTQQAGAVNYSYAYPWPQQMYAYPGYPNMGFPGYNYYNMNMNAYSNMGYGNNQQYYGQNSFPFTENSMMMNAGMMGNPSVSAENTAEPTGSDQPADMNQTVNMLASQPPPPPPSTPPEDSKQDQQFKGIRNHQAPGAPSIRFNLPKPKIQNKANNQGPFQNNRGNKNNFNYTRLRSNFGNRLSRPSSPAVKNFNTEPSEFDSKDGNKHKPLDFNNRNWPPSLRKYIDDAFIKCKSAIDKDQVEIILKGKLYKALGDETLWEKDWTKEPLPNIHSERLEKEQDDGGYIPLKVGSAAKNFRHFPKPTPSKNIQKTNSRSRSRSPRSISPHSRRVVRRRRYSGESDSSVSSNSNQGVKKTIPGSYINSPSVEQHNKWNIPSNTRKKKKKQKKYKLQSSQFTVDNDIGSDDRLQRRAARFEIAGKKDSSILLTIKNPMAAVDDPADIDWSSYAIVGTSQDIEKPFLRLTSAVDASTIRPVNVLMKSLQMVKARWILKQDYHFACEQLKSIRQDLVVQCVRDEFTIQAYETHARIALEKGDHTEFNQCQSQLRVLYEEIQGGNRLEFVAYRILYNIYATNTREIKNILATLRPEEKEDPSIKHALALNRAWTLNNFHLFFKLYRVAPKMSGFIIDWFLKRERMCALKIYTKSYVPTLPVAFVMTELGFPSEKDCLLFLEEAKCVLSDDRSSIQCKDSKAVLTS